MNDHKAPAQAAQPLPVRDERELPSCTNPDDFIRFLNDRRGFNVSAVFHEVCEQYRTSLKEARAALQQPAPEAQQGDLARDYARALDAINGHVVEIKRLEQQMREYFAFRNMVNRHAPEFHADPEGIRDVWYWQGDGTDDLGSMVHQLPIVIRAEQLRELLTAAKPESPQPAQAVPLSDEQRKALFDEVNGLMPGLDSPEEMFATIVRFVERACASAWGVKLAGGVEVV